MEIVETDVFEEDARRIFFEEEYDALIHHLSTDPGSGKIIPGGGGLRKLRWQARGHGKRGGARVIYYWYVSGEQIFLLRAYGKNEQDDLTPVQLKQLRQLIGE